MLGENRDVAHAIPALNKNKLAFSEKKSWETRAPNHGKRAAGQKIEKAHREGEVSSEYMLEKLKTETQSSANSGGKKCTKESEYTNTPL